MRSSDTWNTWLSAAGGEVEAPDLQLWRSANHHGIGSRPWKEQRRSPLLQTLCKFQTGRTGKKKKHVKPIKMFNLFKLQESLCLSSTCLVDWRKQSDILFLIFSSLMDLDIYNCWEFLQLVIQLADLISHQPWFNQGKMQSTTLHTWPPHPVRKT